MRHGKRGYDTYRGRSTATDKLRVTAVILFVLVLLVGAGLLFGQEYIVYTDNGLRLDLPFLQQEEQKQPEKDLENVTVVVEPEQSEPDASQIQPEVPADQPQPPLRAVELTLDAVADGTALEQARSQGANAIILEMKDDRGKLGYFSALPLASQAGANVQPAGINEAIKALAAEDITLVARVSCFRDHSLAGEMAYAIETNPGRRWCDLEIVRWSSPAKAAVRSYLTDVVRELAGLGFDEIVLEHWGFPSQADGHLEYIKKGEFYDPESLEPVITAFLEEMKTGLEGTGAVLSLRGEADLLEGVQDHSGRTLAQLAGLEGRVWMESTEGAAQALEGAGMQQAQDHLVELVPALTEETTGHQALLNAN